MDHYLYQEKKFFCCYPDYSSKFKLKSIFSAKICDEDEEGDADTVGLLSLVDAKTAEACASICCFGKSCDGHSK